MKRFKDFLEEDGGAVAGVGGGGPTNSVGSGAIAGVGIGPQGEPGVKLPKNKKSPVMFSTKRKGYYG